MTIRNFFSDCKPMGDARKAKAICRHSMHSDTDLEIKVTVL